MKKTVLLSCLITLCICLSNAQSPTLPPSGDNQKSKVIQWIGLVEVSITYSSPDVHLPSGHDRTGQIWGGAAHYGFKDLGGMAAVSKVSPWRAGANENTVITFSHDVQIDGKDLKAGSYGLFLDVEKDGPWNWIFSKNYSSWGSFAYDPAEDALRVSVTPADAEYTEFLTYNFGDRKSDQTTLYLQWEKKKIGFTIAVPNINDVYIATIRNDMRSLAAIDYHNWSRVAQFCADKKINLEEAFNWAKKAVDPRIGGVEDFTTLSTIANVQTALGRDKEAEETMNKAIQMPSASMLAVHQYGRTLLTAGKKEKALEIFQMNAKKHPEEKFTTYVGLARGYTALGNKKEAIKHWEFALKNVPESQKSNIASWEAELKKLKEG